MHNAFRSSQICAELCHVQEKKRAAKIKSCSSKMFHHCLCLECQSIGKQYQHVLSSFFEENIPKEKIIEKRSNLKLRNIWKTQTRLERGRIVATPSCTEFRNIFRRYVIVIWKESPSSKRRALHKCKLDFASWVLIHRLGIDLTFENQLYYKASDRAPTSRNQAASPLCGVG